MISSILTSQYSAGQKLPQNQPPKMQQPVFRIQTQGVSASPFSLGLPQQRQAPVIDAQAGTLPLGLPQQQQPPVIDAQTGGLPLGLPQQRQNIITASWVTSILSAYRLNNA